MLDPNTEYELLAKEIYETLHKSEGINTINLKHNTKILGKSGCEHQIDVYWEFEMVGEIHRIAVECKNYTSNVSVGKIRDFFGVLHDIGNIKGIFISKIGFQNGAKKFADYYGITLKELRYPSSEDWEGRVKTMIFNFSLFVKKITKTDIELDGGWILENTSYEKSQLTEIIIPSGNSEETLLLNHEGKPINNINNLINQIPSELKESKGEVKKIDLEDTYMADANGIIVKLRSITFYYDVVAINEQSIIDGEQIAKAILKDVKSGSRKFFDIKGNVK